MGQCIIFCAAGFDSLLAPIGPEDVVIAADGGLRHTRALGITPHVILGDFDSLGSIPEGANVFPVEKDDTDAMLAVRQGLRMGQTRFLLYGGMDGPRLDHTIANFQTLQFLTEHGARGYLAGSDYLATVACGETLTFPKEASGIISLFCLGPDARGIDLEGLYYPLRDGTLTSGFPLGVSNHFTGTGASVTVREGSVLVLWDRAVGLPERTLLKEA